MKGNMDIKNEDHVTFPLVLDLLPFTVAHDVSFSTLYSFKTLYELYASF